VGNRLRGDDAVGSIVAKRLRAFEPSAAIDGGIAPENHLRAIQRAEPGTVYVVDALDSGETPGHVTVFSFEDLPAGGISTHAVSLAVLREYLAMEGLRNIQLVGVQPGSLRMGRTLSRAVREAARTLVAAFEDLIEPPVRG
jgi:hydrogenase 3 maturation protease